MVKSKTNSESAVLSAVKANTEAINSVVQTLQMFTGAQVAPVAQVAQVAPQPAPVQQAAVEVRQPIEEMKQMLRTVGVQEHEFVITASGSLRVSKPCWDRVRNLVKITNEQSIVKVE